MAQIIRTETRQRGFFGKTALVVFWLFNALMAWSLIAGLGGAGEVAQGAATEAERAGAAIGTAIGAGMILAFWFLGAAVLGMMVYFSRGKVVVTETRRE